MMMGDARRIVIGSARWFINWAGSGSVIVDNELSGRTGESTPMRQIHAGIGAK